MIYFVDEDIQYANEFSVPLILRGYDVEIIPNADLAYHKLEKAEVVDLAIIDIMLATADAEETKFSRDATQDFVKTGLLLMEYLRDLKPKIFPKKFVVLTAASDRNLVQTINETCKRMEIEVLRKMDYTSPRKLADKIEQLVK